MASWGVRTAGLVALGWLAACGPPRHTAGASGVDIDAEQLMADVFVLAADDMEARLVGTPGSARARAYVEMRFAEAGIRPFPGGYLQPFTFEDDETGEAIEGVNVLGVIEGARADRVIVVSAHYDHEGVKNGEIYNGADDNASGVAALLQIAQRFAGRAPQHTLVFAAFDAEEGQHAGATQFVADPPVAFGTIALNVNLDMVSQSEVDELYLAGGFHSPWLSPWLEWIANDASVTLLQGHDSPAWGEGQDWTWESDHDAFHAAGVPFLYFGVEDHPRYHQPTDDPETIPVDFFVRSTASIVRAVEILDQELDAVVEARAVWREAQP
jgi:Zn-dependent M28 family amino/carboxypeptidase